MPDFVDNADPIFFVIIIYGILSVPRQFKFGSTSIAVWRNIRCDILDQSDVRITTIKTRNFCLDVFKFYPFGTEPQETTAIYRPFKNDFHFFYNDLCPKKFYPYIKNTQTRNKDRTRHTSRIAVLTLGYPYSQMLNNSVFGHAGLSDPYIRRSHLTFLLPHSIYQSSDFATHPFLALVSIAREIQ